jgi:hypothetical protein
MQYSLRHRESFRNITLDFINKRGKEVWLFHPKLEDVLVSNLGRVKNFSTDYIYKQRKNRSNYIVVSIRKNNLTKTFYVSRLVAQTFLNYCGDSYEANHINGNKNDNSLQNINWLDRSENLQHAKDMGLFKKHNVNCSKYTKEIIFELYEFKKLGYTYKQIGAAYKIAPSYICTLLKKEGYV